MNTIKIEKVKNGYIIQYKNLFTYKDETKVFKSLGEIKKFLDQQLGEINERRID